MCNLIKSQLDYQSDIADAKREGRKEGRAEGRKEGRVEGMKEGRVEGHTEKALEIARKMKAASKPLSEIAEFTGLPADSIERI